MNISRNAPIGVIDSGIGGLSLLKHLTIKYPNENYIYLADNAYMPYGNKSKKWLISRINELVDYLYSNFDVKLVILACNTASICSLQHIKTKTPVKVLGLDLNIYSDAKYKIICTKQSSKNYANLNVYPCNNLANAIEDGLYDITTLRKKIFRTISKANIIEDNIVLGCTHYELVNNIFKQVYPDKNFILPGYEFVTQLKLANPNMSDAKGDVLMISTLATKSYIDKLWKIFKK
ncbi:MAG: hypothetical protein J6Q15_00300 [Clostridia bacterium]|nr:hypothetical protein [Clostridia bacterium]